MFVERFSMFNPYSQDNSFKKYIKWARRSPALIGFLQIIASDILSDKIEFEPVDKNSSSGKNKVMKSERFWRKNDGLEVVEETIYDMLLNGIGYNWIGLLSDRQLKEFCGLVAEEIFDQNQERKADDIFSLIKMQSSDVIVKRLRHIASSTVSIQSDEFGPLRYVQRVGVNTKAFDPKEVIPFKLMPFDGKVYPFPPMEAILSEVYLLWLISQNYVSFFENGGNPDKVYILPKELAGSKNHTALIETLKKYKKIQNKHGNLVFTGDISIEDLQKVESQMEHKDLGLYLVGVLAMIYAIPSARIPFLVGKAANMGDAGGLADSGYWRKISVLQSKIEAPYNKMLWNPFFGTNIKFRRGYLQDEVRETQNEMQRTSVAEQRMRLGLWPADEAARYLKIDQDVLAKGQAEKKKRDEEELKSGMMRQFLDNDRNVIPGQDNRLKAKKKQETQVQNQQNAGGKKINP